METIEAIYVILALICVLAGVILLLFPRVITRLSRVTDRQISTDRIRELLDKEISTEKLSDLLNRQIDINDQLIRFDRLIGLGALIVGVVMFFLK